MKGILKWTYFAAWLLYTAGVSYSQGDYATYDTYSRYSPTVFSVDVEIPREFILEQYKNNIDLLQEYQNHFTDALTGNNQTALGVDQFEMHFMELERVMDQLKDRLISNNRIRGTAFAVDPHHLVTVNTVVKNATLGGEITITDDYKNSVKAYIQGIDEMTGVAVLRVDDVTFEQYVDINRYTTALTEASYIVSIQRPYNLPPAPYPGMIGGYYRSLGVYPLEKYIQTDLPLYPGNNGAPVFSPTGQLVGVVATEYPPKQYPSITFLIPADYVVDSAQAIIEKGYRERGGFPGVQFILSNNGITVSQILPNCPYTQKLQEGDVIVGFNDITELVAIYYSLLDSRPNESVKLSVRRNNEQVQVVLETRLLR